jgi:hypothetical protein
MRVRSIHHLLLVGLSLISMLLLASCRDSSSQSGDFSITVEVDGRKLVYRYDKQQSVGQFLQEIGVTLGEFDEVNPLLQTQLRDKMRITVTRVKQLNDCSTTEVLPFTTERQFTQNLKPGETQVIQTGVNGTVQVCYRITEKDGVQTERVEISRVPLVLARNEIIAVGSEPLGTLIPIEGALTYISNGQAWIIQGNTANLNPLTESGFLDGRVFDLSASGKQLLYTRRTADETDPPFSNELWVVLDVSASFPRQVQLLPEDVRTAQWVGGERAYTVSYSTANPDGAGWRAYNDLYLMQMDPETGEALPRELKELISSNSLGSYAYWGRRFAWSPDGTQLAWANADSLGIVDLEKSEFITLMDFREYAPLLELYQGATVWIPTLSWSADGNFLVTTVHGQPYADEAPEDSIIFDLAVINVETGVQINPFFQKSGIWANPVYSPLVDGADGNPTYAMAYFQAREPLNSPGTQYDLWIADRDGSNARVVFPGLDRPGFRSPDPEDGIAWSPTARQIAVIYQGNLWIIEVKTGQSYQITSDGQASRPRWSHTR